MSVALEALHTLSMANLRALGASLREGQLSLGLTRTALEQLLGRGREEVFSCLRRLQIEGMTPTQCALVVEAMAQERERAPDPARLFELVLSGPDVPGVPTGDTAAAVQTLVQEAREEVLLVGYVIHNGAILFEPLAMKMRDNPGLKVVFCLDIARRFGDTSLSSEIVRRFVIDFRQRHWPWPELPELYYDPRALSETPDQRASLHAKCVVVDQRAALVTSANFTEAAQNRNVEAGVLVRYAPFAERVADYFFGLINSGGVRRCAI